MIYDKARRLKRELFFRIRNKSRLSTGFSMLEAVVVVGVLLALAVGGFFAYGPIVTNAKLAKLKSAASQVYTAATVFQVDGDPTTKPQDALDAWNASSTTIKVGFFDTKVVAVPAMTTAEDGFVPAEGEDFCIQATDVAKPEIEAKSGDCPAPPSDEENPTGEVTSEPVPERQLTVLKNGDFSEGLSYWSAIGEIGSPPNVTSGVASIYSVPNVFSGLSQMISIPTDGVTHAEYSYSRPRYAAITIFTVSAYDLTGNLIKEVKRHSLPYDVAVPMTLSTVDLTEFAGQDIKLAFQISHNGSNYQLSLDNISVQTTTAAPSAPTDVKIAVNDTNATVSWNKPAVGSNSVTEYEVTPYRNGKPLSILKTTGEPPATSTVFKGLASGEEYTFKVAATNKLGTSVQSEPSSPYSRPAQLWTNGDFSAGLTGWNAMGGAGSGPNVISGVASIYSISSTVLRGISQTVTIPTDGITYAEYSYSRPRYSGVTTFTVSAYDPSGSLLKEVKRHSIPDNVALPMTLSTVDLTEFAGQDIKLAFQVLHNGNGYQVSLDNTSVQTTTAVPSAPKNVTISVSDTDATISWNKPDSGANSVTEYTITPYRNGSSLPVLKTNGEPPATSTVFRGLASGGEYTFKVAATNKFGTSIQSAPSEPHNRSTQVLKNGDFSAGLTGWNAIGGAGTGSNVISGVASIYSASNTVPRGLSQTVSIPTDGITQAAYSYSRPRYSGVTTFTVSAYDPAGNLIKELRRHSIPDNVALPMTPATVDLTEFAGRDIKLAFQVLHNGNGYQVTLDNISIVTQ